MREPNVDSMRQKFFMAQGAKWKGRIELIIGPMFSGKTTELLKRIATAETERKSSVILKPLIDTRSPDIQTHTGISHAAVIYQELCPHINECMQYDVIGIDEGQFFHDILEFSKALATAGKLVVIAGLDGDYLRRPFGQIPELALHCDHLIKLITASLKTGENACFTRRTVNSDQLELIGGSEFYESVSRSSFIGKETAGEVHLTIGGSAANLGSLLVSKYGGLHKKVMVISQTWCESFPDSVRMVDYLPQYEEVADVDVIGVVEGQKFKDIARWADEMANNGKLIEIVASCESEDCGQIVPLVPLCEVVVKSAE